LFWLGKPAQVAQQDIERLQNTLQDNYTSIQTEALQPGTKMTIPAGPFKGKEGTITNANDKRVQLVLEELGCVITLIR
jgi:transcription antitermination factor NusG